LLGEIAPVTEELTGEAFDPAGYRFTIIDVTGGNLERQSLTAVIDHQVELEAVAPPDRGLAAPGDRFEDCMAVDPAVMAHHQRRGVDKGDPGRLPLPGLEIDAEGD
jgi:hypothetical protein